LADGVVATVVNGLEPPLEAVGVGAELRVPPNGLLPPCGLGLEVPPPNGLLGP